MSAVSKAVKSF